MTTRYENTDGMDDKISFGEQVIKPGLDELQNLWTYIDEKNPDVKKMFRYKPIAWMGRNELKEHILYIMDNNKGVALPLQGMVTISRLRKEK